MEMRQLGDLWPVSALTLGGGGLGLVWGNSTREEAVATALESLEESDEIEDGFVAKALASAVTPERRATATLEEGVMDVIKDAPRPGLA